MLQKKCVVCGKPFTTRNKRQVCCSPDCSSQHQRNLMMARHEDTCDVCGKIFMRPRGSTRVTCSRECVKALREASTKRNATKRDKKSELAAINREARKLGMTYGQYQAMKYKAEVRVQIEPAKKRFIIYD